MELEKTDRKIVNVLVNNSRLSLRQIAQKIDVSVATVMNHLKNLEKEKVIKGYTTKLDYEKIGYDIEAIIEVRISKGKLHEVESKIAVHPNVFAVYDVTGTFDAIIMARFPTRRLMDNFLKKIQTYEFVERTETKLILKTIKEESIGLE
ncbi:MAG TPA: Lrp/AsnC family transcriptional regulator [Candidatus Nanoarchaeia archaeon]|nr:Lrp/AsnC family transcriptional regulator [Candidatus Nanoarchaeia archaeon]